MRRRSLHGYRPRRVAAVVLALVALSALLPAAALAADAGPAATWPMQITDYAGRRVTIPAEPRRILSMAPSNTEVLFALGLGDRVVGVDTFSDYPAEATRLPRIGDLFSPNHEQMFVLQPDLVLAIAGSEKMWGKLAEYGVPVVVVQPTSLEQVLESILLIGRITGADGQAGVLVADMRQRMATIRQRLALVTLKPRVFWEIWHDPLMSVGPGAFMDDMLGLVGAENIAGDTGQAWPVVNLETMIARNPEVIISSDPDWTDRMLAGEHKPWLATTAIRYGHVVYIDPSLTSRPGPRIIAGLEAVAKAVHPWLFGFWWW